MRATSSPVVYPTLNSSSNLEPQVNLVEARDQAEALKDYLRNLECLYVNDRTLLKTSATALSEKLLDFDGSFIR